MERSGASSAGIIQSSFQRHYVAMGQAMRSAKLARLAGNDQEARRLMPKCQDHIESLKVLRRLAERGGVRLEMR